MGSAFPLALTAALNPTLLTATMAMLFATDPKRLMAGYLLGAYTISITLGIVVVFALKGSSAPSNAQTTVNPAVDVVLGAVALLVAFVLMTDRDAALRERRAAHAAAKGPKEPPRWRRALDHGSARTSFVVGVALTLPGASYLACLHRISKADAPTTGTVVAIIVANIIMLVLIELPLVGFALAPGWTRDHVGSFTTWVGSHTRAIVSRLALGLGVILLARAAITALG